MLVHPKIRYSELHTTYIYIYYHIPIRIRKFILKYDLFLWQICYYYNRHIFIIVLTRLDST